MNIFLAIVVFGILAILLTFLYDYNKLLSKDFTPNEEKIGENNNKKALLLWVPSKHQSAEKFKNIIVSTLVKNGYFVTINHPLSTYTYDYNDFEFICFLSPVYFGKVSKTMCEKMVSTSFIKKKVAIVCLGRALNTKKEIDYMKSLIDKENTISVLKVNNEQEKILVDFINSAVI